jgi:hypothetical protein
MNTHRTRQRTRRRGVLALAMLVPALVAAAAHGCSDEPPFESACRWLADPENCFRKFHEDMIAARWPDNLNGDCRTYPPLPVSAWPTEASQAGPGVSNGSFQTRAMLDTCTLYAGGQVTVTPPLDLTMWPPSAYAAPTTYALTFINFDGSTCGSATYTSPHGFSLTINPPPDAGTTLMTTTDAALDTMDGGLEMDDAGPPITSGTYTQYNPPGRDSFDVTCPSGESHHFTLDEINLTAPDAGACPALADTLPSASLQVYLGGVGTAGALSFAITFPPEAEAFPDSGLALQGEKVIYFNCAIPAALETCVDGVKDGVETDVDCGGSQVPSMRNCGNCPARCQAGQQCICDGDCDEHLVCAVNPMSGMRQCAPQDAGVTKDFPTCSYKDPPLPCTMRAPTRPPTPGQTVEARGRFAEATGRGVGCRCKPTRRYGQHDDGKNRRSH